METDLNDAFDKRMALEVITDAMTALDTPENRGIFLGLCGAFYMCGLLERWEWAEYIKCICKLSQEDIRIDCGGFGFHGPKFH